MDYASQLRAMLGWENDSMPSFPKMSRIRFGLRDGKPNLVDMYAEHSVRETQPRDDDGSLTQLRDWERIGVEDLTLIESLVAKNDPEPNLPGHDYQQCALDRERLASNRLRLANRYQQMTGKSKSHFLGCECYFLGCERYFSLNFHSFNR